MQECDPQCAISMRREMSILSNKIDLVQSKHMDMWMELHTELDQLKRDFSETNERHVSMLSTHGTELSYWRWALVVCLSMVLASGATAVMRQLNFPVVSPPPIIGP